MSDTQFTITCEKVSSNEGHNLKENMLVIGATKVKALNQLIESDKSLIYVYAPGNTPENNYPVIVATSEGNLPDVDFNNPTGADGNDYPAASKLTHANSYSDYTSLVIDDARVFGDVTFNETSLIENNATVRDTNLNNVTASGNSSITGGYHDRLTIKNKAIINGVTTEKCTIKNNAYISGNIKLSNVALEGDIKIDIPHSDTVLNLAENSEKLVYNIKETKPNRKTRQFYNAGKSFDRKSLLNMLYITKTVLDDPDALSGVWCIDHATHKENMGLCHCMLWYPLYLMGNGIAMQYFFRADGILKPAGHALSVNVEDSIRNPYSAFTNVMMEDRMRLVIDEILQSDAHPTASYGVETETSKRWKEAVTTYIPETKNFPVVLSRTKWYNYRCDLIGAPDLRFGTL